MWGVDRINSQSLRNRYEGVETWSPGSGVWNPDRLSSVDNGCFKLVEGQRSPEEGSEGMSKHLKGGRWAIVAIQVAGYESSFFVNCLFAG